MSTIAKFLSKPPDGFSTQISSATVSSTDLSVTLDSTSGLPTEGVGQFFKKDANGDLVAGTVEFVHWTNTSGNTITFSDTDDRGITGSDSGAQSYVADDYFEVWASSYYVGGVGGLIEHGPTGDHRLAQLKDTSGNETIKTPATASAVNEVTVTNAATANDPSITATGDDTNIGLKIKAKGSGKVKLGAVDLQFPNVDGTSGQVIKTDGAGVLSWVTATAQTSTAKVYNAGNQTLNDDTWTTLTFDSEAWDTDTIHDTGSNTGRLTLPSTGKWLLVGGVNFANSSTTNDRQCRILKGGATVMKTVGARAGATKNTFVEIAVIVDATATNYFELQALQDRGGTLDVVGGEHSTYWQCHRLS